ncbi:hypothetical protein MYT24_06470 [Haemophilus influenzae]
MTLIKLQDLEKQAKYTALFDELNAKKAELVALDDELKMLESKQAKNAATINAVRNEFETEIGKIKAKFDEDSELTLDDYADMQKLKAELKARVDFFTATGEELERKIYDKREAVYRVKNVFLSVRKDLYRFTALALIDEFIEANRDKITLFKGMFVYSGEYDAYTGRDGHDEFNDVLIKKFNVEMNPALPPETALPPPYISGRLETENPNPITRGSIQSAKRNRL